MKKIKQGNLAKFDNKLNESFEEATETVQTGESEKTEENTKDVAICYIEDFALTSSQSKMKSPEKKARIPKYAIVVDLGKCKDIEDLKRYRMSDLTATARANFVDLGKKRLKADIVSAIWEWNSIERPPKRMKVEQECGNCFENSISTHNEIPDLSQHYGEGETSNGGSLLEKDTEFISSLLSEDSNRYSQVVSAKFSINLTIGDLSRFVKKDGLLNNQRINFYLAMMKEHLESGESDLEIMSTFFFTKLVSKYDGYNFQCVSKWIRHMSLFSEKCTILIPIHVMEEHWVLGVIHIDVDPVIAAKVRVLDSMNLEEEIKKIPKHLKRYIKDLFCSLLILP